MIEKIINKIRTTNSSFIFAGSKGVGKKHAALEIAKSVLCRNVPACNDCDECRRVNEENHPNVIIVRPEGEDKDIKIEGIRELIRSLTFSAAEGNKRFVIIDEAHRMNKSSSNAMLKTLEEPPRDTVFMLLSSNLYSMLPTIISRCEVVKFPPMQDEKMVKILKISPSHHLIPYSMGSISMLTFYLANELQVTRLINFVEKPVRSYEVINDLADDIIGIVASDSKAQEIENMENIISLLMFGVLKNGDRGTSVLKCIEELKAISKNIYKNTSPSIVLENMLLEIANSEGGER